MTNPMTDLLRRARTGAALATAAALTLASGVYADVAEYIPADALAVLKGNDMQRVSDDVAALSREWGLDQFDPAFADPLGAFKEQTGINQGVDFAGDVGLYLPKGADYDADVLPHVLLVPIDDFEAFRANFEDEQEAGEGLFQVTMKGMDEPVFLADYGDYAAISPLKELLGQKPKNAIEFAGPTGERVEGRDLVLYANFKELGPALKRAIEEEGAFEDGLAEFEENFDEEVPEQFRAYKPVARAGIKQVYAIAESFLRDAEAATVSLEADPEAGIGANVVAQFKEGSYLANAFGDVKATDDSLLAGLPTGTYLATGGAVNDAELGTKLFDDVFGPVVAELGNVEAPGAETLAELADAAKMLISASESSTQGYLAPATPGMGGGALVQQINIQRGDADAILDITREFADATPKLLREFSQAAEVPEGEMPDVSVQVEEDAKTVAGVSFTKLSTQLPQDDPMQQMASNMIFGPEGQTQYLANLDDKVLAVSGLSDPQIEQAVAAARAGDAPLADAPGMAAIVRNLPKERSAVAYVHVAELARTGLGFAQAFGQAPPVQIPENLPPVGLTFGPAEDSIEIAAFVPKDLVGAMIVTALQVQQGAAGQGGAPQGGL